MSPVPKFVLAVGDLLAAGLHQLIDLTSSDIEQRLRGGGKSKRACLRELEEVLLAVNDLEAAVLHPATDIACVQPAILINGLPRILLILPVSLEDAGAAYADLHRASSMVSVYLWQAVLHDKSTAPESSEKTIPGRL